MIPLTITEAGEALRDGSLTSVELTRAVQEAADRLDETLGTWLARFDETALARAAEADAELAAGNDRGPLHGIPLGIKDILATDEGPTTAQSLVLDPTWGDQGDGPVLRRLREAGAVILGKTTTMEFAIGRPDFAMPFPVPRNPWNPDRWTGGSSSGTGNGVASGQMLGGLGTDTAGSVRLPASYNGITGHKPTFGLVPKSGCVPLGLSYDHIGPMTRAARDAAAMLDVMAGPDPSDRTTVEGPAGSYLDLVDRGGPDGNGLDGLRIGRLSNAEIDRSSAPSTRVVFDRAVDELAAAGADVVEVEVPHYRELSAGAFLALEAEAFAWHRRHLIERWDDYGRPTRLTIVQGALIGAGDLVQIERVRHLARALVVDLMDRDGIDLLISPTTGWAAAPFAGADPEAIATSALHTPAWNSTGFPALSVPMGFDDDHLPLGLQLIGRPLADGLVLAAGHAYQRRTGWHLEVPPHHR
jgi:aspartyl-tRNA(Asn)/glutamyl-tRNA(Gln) amidotransferase subunit A